MTMSRRTISWIIAFTATFSAIYGIYTLGFSGQFQFDDEPNLGWLSVTNSLEQAYLFISSGNSGPLGRPIALASFYLLNSADWPGYPAGFFRINTLIHLLNGVLVAWLFTLTGIDSKGKNHWFGLIVAVLWLLQPMLASTSFMAVQRMTSLAATFVLAGLISYVFAREHVASSPRTALSGMTAGLLVFGLLAAFTKENGLLLIGYVLVLEYTLLAANGFPSTPAFRRWRSLVLWLPVVAVIVLLALKLPDIAASYIHRAFTLPERLQTEALILLDYARLVVFPRRSELGPFRDDYPIYSDLFAPQVLAALALIITALVLAIRYRKKAPFVAFAILWFLVGHSMESTLLPLELYFEHRNYLPAIGIVALIAVAPWKVSAGLSRVVILALAIYCLILAFVLGQTSSTWGNPMLAATLWHEEHPASERAALFLAGQYASNGDYRAALRVTDRTVQLRPDDSGLSSSALFAACNMNDGNLFRARLDDVLERLSHKPSSLAAVDTAEKLMQVRRQKCPWLGNDTMLELTNSMLINPKYSRNRLLAARLFTINADLAYDDRLFDDYIRNIEQAFLHNPQPRPALRLVTALMQEGLWEAAHEKLQLVESRMPEHRLRKAYWKKMLHPLRQQIEQHLNLSKSAAD